MVNYVVAIPSYKRAKKQETVEYFSSLGFTKDRLYVFVQTEDDFKAYKKYEDLATLVFMPADNIARARNNILSYFSSEENVLMCDDDISLISRLKNGKLEEVEKVDEEINKCFEYACKNGSPLWGMYPCYNAFFMSEDISTLVTVNTVLGFTKIRGDLMFDESYKAKEDIELCSRILKADKKVIRYNFLAPKARHRGNSGGCHDMWKSDENAKTVERLCEVYPEILKPNSKKPNEVKMNIKDKKVKIGDDASKPVIKNNYGSPRWTGEIIDCSLPVTLDTYSNCSFGCVYCFSQFQRGIGNGKENYFFKQVKSVNVEKIRKILTEPENNQFWDWVKDKRPIQYGGLSDQFDMFEKKYGVTYEVLKVFKELNYPLCFSTKGTWWVFDEKYRELLKGQDNWNCKFSIITLDEEMAKKIEVGVPSPQERLRAMKEYTSLNKGGATLRLRPFIIGVSSKDYLELIKQAHDAGATAVTTEFFCLEQRSANLAKEHYKVISDCCGFDIVDFYRKHSETCGYLRLNRKIKEKYIVNMRELCDKLGMRFYVSDAHFKEVSDNGCCCALPPDWNYSRGNFSYALQVARRTGEVHWKDIEKDMYFFDKTDYSNAINCGGQNQKANFKRMNIREVLRYFWNNPASGHSPFKAFGKILVPSGTDDDGNLIYKYNDSKSFLCSGSSCSGCTQHGFIDIVEEK